MPAASAVLTPFTRSPASTNTAGARHWVKRILPVGDVDYKGRKLRFTPDYLKSLADAFGARAYDQVPFQIAPDDNRHSNDPERFGGEITGMEARDDGLYVTVSATERGDRVLAENPRLGVSARIVEEYARSDGKFFPAAIQHVLGTLDPRIPGLGAWQAVEASNDAQVTYDLSNLHFAGDEGNATMPDTPDPRLTADQQARLGQLLDLPPEQWASLVSGSQLSDADLQALAGEAGQQTAPAEDEIAAWVDSLSDEELAALEAEMEGETAAAAAGAGLSYEAMEAIELANAQSQDALAQLQSINTELDRERFVTERTRMVGQMGIPPHIVDMAQPLLQGSGHVVELSGGQAVDSGQIMRAVLTEYSKVARLLDLDPVELGSPIDAPDPGGQADQEREDLVSRAKQMMGLGR